MSLEITPETSRNTQNTSHKLGYNETPAGITLGYSHIVADLGSLGNIWPELEVRGRTESQHTQTLPSCCSELGAQAEGCDRTAMLQLSLMTDPGDLRLSRTCPLCFSTFTISPSLRVPHYTNKASQSNPSTPQRLPWMCCRVCWKVQLCSSSPKPSFTFTGYHQEKPQV